MERGALHPAEKHQERQEQEVPLWKLLWA